LRRFRVPEIAIGFLLATTLWALIGVIYPENNGRETKPSQNAAPIAAEEAETNGRIADYNRTLDWLTAALVIANLALWWATWRGSIRQSRDMEASIAVATQAARAAQIAARAAQHSADVAERSLTSVNRPYMYALKIGDFAARAFDDGGGGFVLPLSVANYGETPADIEEIRAGFSVTATELPEAPNVIAIGNSIYGPHERTDKLEFALTENITFLRATDGTPLPHLKPGEYLYFRIIIEYRGPFTEGHESSFCWRWSERHSYMMRWGGRDYNYVA
jgi:hypothetical protein